MRQQMRVRPVFMLGLVMVLFIGLGLRHFWNSTYSSYWNDMNEIRMTKSKETKPVYFDGELEPDFPDEEMNNATFYGVDTNRNGVRDDIEIWINRSFQTRNERLAYKQYQKALNREYANGEDKKNFPEAIEFANRLLVPGTNAQLCISYIEEELLKLDPNRGYTKSENNMREIDELTINSFSRRESRATFYHWIDSSGTEEKYGFKNYPFEEKFKFCSFSLSNFK